MSREPVTVALSSQDVCRILGLEVGRRINWPTGPSSVTVEWIKEKAGDGLAAHITIADPIDGAPNL